MFVSLLGGAHLYKSKRSHVGKVRTTLHRNKKVRVVYTRYSGAIQQSRSLMGTQCSKQAKAKGRLM